MSANDAPSVSVSRGGSAQPDGDVEPTVIWVRGEHDVASRVHLQASIAHAARIDAADLVVDLSGVTYMGASTIGALVTARNRLRARSRSLSIRAPSPMARRLLDVCELGFLIDDDPIPAQPAGAPALGSWVAVPAAPSPDVQSPSQQPARAAARRHVEPARSAQHARAPS